jgi:protein-tyrosine phosphatase
MNHLIEQACLSEKIICDSAGTSNYHIGEPPDRRMTAAATRRGIQLKGKARQFSLSDFENFDLILAMDRENYRDIRRLDPSGKYQDKVRLICDFATNYSLKDVPDPYYGGLEGFDRVIDLLWDACTHLLEEIKPKLLQSD